MKRVAAAAALAVSLLGAGASIAPANADSLARGPGEPVMRHSRCPPGENWVLISTLARADGKWVTKHHWGCLAPQPQPK